MHQNKEIKSQEWPAEQYAIGSFIQATIADSLIAAVELKKNDRVLDVGCGNGAYTERILAKVPEGSVLGIDASQNMLQLAEAVKKRHANFALKKDNVLTMHFDGEFDRVVSFWCLQWAAKDIKKAFENIVRALKPGGKFFTLFPAGDDPFINGYYAVKDSQQFPSLDHFKAPVEYKDLQNIKQKLQDIPCKRIKINKHHSALLLPSLDVFRKFVHGIAFYQGQIAEKEIQAINEAMVDWYQQECLSRWQGETQFHCSLYLVTGER